MNNKQLGTIQTSRLVSTVSKEDPIFVYGLSTRPNMPTKTIVIVVHKVNQEIVVEPLEVDEAA